MEIIKYKVLSSKKGDQGFSHYTILHKNETYEISHGDSLVIWSIKGESKYNLVYNRNNEKISNINELMDFILTEVPIELPLPILPKVTVNNGNTKL